jgi:hypothetical protein
MDGRLTFDEGYEVFLRSLEEGARKYSICARAARRYGSDFIEWVLDEGVFQNTETGQIASVDTNLTGYVPRTIWLYTAWSDEFEEPALDKWGDSLDPKTKLGKTPTVKQKWSVKHDILDDFQERAEYHSYPEVGQELEWLREENPEGAAEAQAILESKGPPNYTPTRSVAQTRMDRLES